MKRFVKMIALCTMITLVAALFCAPLQALGTTNRTHIIGNGCVGKGVGNRTTLVDFTTNDLCGFETLGNTSDPIFYNSGTWNASVLYVWLDSIKPETGIRGTLATTSQLNGASSLSVDLLAQYIKTQTYTATLILEGTDKNGAPLSLEASATATSGSWQTVTFDISAFVDAANPEAPCTVTVLTSSPAESEQFVLWIHSLYTSQLDTYPEFLIPTAATACGFFFGFFLFFIIYRATCKRNRRTRKEVR